MCLSSRYNYSCSTDVWNSGFLCFILFYREGKQIRDKSLVKTDEGTMSESVSFGRQIILVWPFVIFVRSLGLRMAEAISPQNVGFVDSIVLVCLYIRLLMTRLLTW